MFLSSARSPGGGGGFGECALQWGFENEPGSILVLLLRRRRMERASGTQKDNSAWKHDREKNIGGKEPKPFTGSCHIRQKFDQSLREVRVSIIGDLVIRSA